MTDDDDVVIVPHVTEIAQFDSSEVVHQRSETSSMQVVWAALGVAEHLEDVQVPLASISKTLLARRVRQYALIEKPVPGEAVYVVSHSICIPRDRDADVLEDAFEVFVELFASMVSADRKIPRTPVGALQTNIIEGDLGVTFTWKQRFVW